MTDPVPKRRWFRWSLRTLFVVMTVVCCWLGYYLNWIQPTLLVDAHLRKIFPSNGRDVSYLPDESAPMRVTAPVLRRVLPHTSFYRTTLWTSQLCYPKVETLISATQTDTGTNYSYCFSPVYDDKEQIEFLQVFVGIRVTSSMEREQVARAITDLFAAITYKGRVGAMRKRDSTIEVELWHGRLLWRQVTVIFSASNAIESVTLVNPKST